MNIRILFLAAHSFLQYSDHHFYFKNGAQHGSKLKATDGNIESFLIP